jgi:cob(I)alamin adenosyltransferase
MLPMVKHLTTTEKAVKKRAKTIAQKEKVSSKEKLIKDTVKSFSNTPPGCYVHVYTGDGSGKTTSALGVALRSLGHDRKVAIVQFLKGRGDEIGEFKLQNEMGSNYNVYQFGRPGFLDKDDPQKEDKELAEKGIKFVRDLLKKDGLNLLILDEINLTIYYRLLTVRRIINLLDFAKKQNKDLDIYLTGRYCPQKLIDYADFATEIKNLKRPSYFFARKGTEF